MKISLSRNGCTSKPNGAQIALQQREMVAVEAADDVVEEALLYFVGQQGHAYRDCILDGGCRTENFVEQNLLTLDFDDGTTVESFLKQCREMYICPSVVYNTFSHTDEHPRFRAIFILSEPITSIAVAKALRRAINYLFPQADQVKSIVQLWQGSTKSGAFIENTRLDVGFIFLLAEKVLKNSTLRQNYKRDMRNKLLLEDAPRVELCNHKNDMPYNILGHNEFVITLRIADSGSADEADEGLVDERLKSNFDWQAQLAGCRWSRECFNGSHWPSENEVFYLCSLYKGVKGGRKRLKQLIETIAAEHGYTPQQKNNLLNALKTARPLPVRCDTIDCPYQSECRKTTPLQCQPIGLGGAYSTATQPRQSLTEAERQLAGHIHDAFACGENTAILNAPCGVGKTQMLIDYISKQTDRKFLYAVPTHELAREIYERFRNVGVPVALVPELDLNDLEPDLRTAYEKRLAVGDSAGARTILFASKNERVREYWLQTDRFTGDLFQQRVVICTHARALTKGSLTKFDAVVYDEDPFFSSIHTTETSVTEISLYAPTEFAEKVQQMPDGLHELKAMPRKQIVEYVRELSSKCSFNMAAVLGAQIVLVDGQKLIFGTKHNLPKSNKNVIASATADDAVARWLLNSDNVKTFKIDSVEMVGKLYQQLVQSSRKRLQTDTRAQIDEYKKIAKTDNVITFKSLENRVEAVAHFGAVAGIDSMKGQDLAIIGTPRNAPQSDLIFSRFCDKTIRADDASEMKMQVCEYNNWKFRFFAAQHPVLRQVQLYTINSHLTQAAGRGRVMREKCSTYIFSELPLADAEII